MQRMSVKVALVLLGLVLLSLVFVFGQKKDAISQGAMPGTFALRDQNSAIAVGRTIAEGELAAGFKSESIKLITIEAKGSDTLKDEVISNGAILDKNTFVTNNNVWVVTFAGSFSPKRYPKENKPIYSTMVIYLRAEDGSVLGVEMHGGVKKSGTTPYPGLDE